MADTKVESKLRESKREINEDNRLSEADIESFVEHGFVLLRGLLSAEDVEAAVADWPETLEKIKLGRNRGELETEGARICREAVATIAAELVTAPGAPLAKVTAIANTNPRPHTPEAVWDRVGSQQTPPHLDNQAVTLSGGGIGAFVFLNQVKHAAGAFMYSPGSPGRMRAWMSANAFESAPGRARSLPVGGILEECTAEPGDVIVFDAHIVHCASANVVGPERQALRLTITPTVPLDLAKGFEDMSAREKAQSVPYMRQRFGERFRLTNPAISDAELAGGFGPVTTCDFLRLGGRIFRFWASSDAPALIQRSVSDDLGAWEVLEPLDLVDDPVTGLHLDYCWPRPRLTVNTRRPDGESASAVFESRDLIGRWREIFHMDGWLLSRPGWLNLATIGRPFRSKKAMGHIVHFVMDQDPSQIFWKAGGGGEPISVTIGGQTEMVSGQWPEADYDKLWSGREGQAHRASGPVTDLFVGVGADWALVADLEGVAHYTTSRFADDFAEALVPITVEGGAVPSRIRCFERTSDYWLLTYLVGDRLYWGEIDWKVSPGHIRPITTTDALRRAFGTLGLTSPATSSSLTPTLSTAPRPTSSAPSARRFA